MAVEERSVEFQEGWNAAVSLILDQCETRQRGWRTVGKVLEHAKAREIEAAHLADVCRNLLTAELVNRLKLANSKDGLKLAVLSVLEKLSEELNKRFANAKKRQEEDKSAAASSEKIAYGFAAHEVNQAKLLVSLFFRTHRGT